MKVPNPASLAGRSRRTILDDVVDLLFGSRCAGCARPGRSWCAACAGATDGPAFRTAPDPCPAGLPPTWAAVRYDGPVREAIVAHKEHARDSLAVPLGALLGRSIAAAVAAVRPAGPVFVVPVPTSPGRIMQRGYDPLRRLSASAVRSARARGVRVSWRAALRLTGKVGDQSELDAAARLRNVQGAFGPAPGKSGAIRGLSVVIVDDIVTTGATLVETTRALTAAGADVRAAAVIAATSRKAR